MTTRIPEPSFGDKILYFIGKKRGLIFPKTIPEAGIYDFYATAVKEGFWKALWRPKNAGLPENSVDYRTYYRRFEELKK